MDILKNKKKIELRKIATQSLVSVTFSMSYIFWTTLSASKETCTFLLESMLLEGLVSRYIDLNAKQKLIFQDGNLF